ncbi:unnamed protein product [Anisakis simplex]|uniref:WD_REPEATS_REGION domain-containing protein n=1 Tax=Anisakis simplex TaxID=6269 RepID=A0A0M3IZ16_ANISI|nr:unnamed protein product [Anisakis simplex]
MSDTSSEILAQLLRKRRIKRKHQEGDHPDNGDIVEDIVDDDTTTTRPTKTYRISKHYFESSELAAQLKALHRHSPKLAESLFVLLKKDLSECDIDALQADEFRRMVNTAAAESTADICELLEQDDWQQIERDLSPLCPLLMPLIAHFKQEPIVYAAQRNNHSDSESKTDTNLVTAMGRCHLIRANCAERATCGTIDQRYVVMGHNSGQISVTQLHDGVYHPPVGSKNANLRRISLNAPIRSCSASGRTYNSIHTDVVYDLKRFGDSVNASNVDIGTNSVDFDGLCSDPLYMSCGGDGLVALWRADNGDELQRYQSSADAVFRLSLPQFDANPQTFISGGIDGSARLYRIDRAHSLRVFPHETPVIACALNSNGDSLLTACRCEKKIRLWDANSGLPQRLFGPIDTQAVFVDFIGDDQVAAVTESSMLYIWKMERDNKLLNSFEVLDGERCTFMLYDGSLLALGGSNSKLQLVRNGELYQRFDQTSNGGRVLDFHRRQSSAEWIALIS